MSLLKYKSIRKWLGNCQCKHQIKTPKIGPLWWVIYDLYYKLYKLRISIWILKNKPGKSNNSLVKKCIESWNASTVFGKGSSNDKAWLYRDINICKVINVK